MKGLKIIRAYGEGRLPDEITVTEDVEDCVPIGGTHVSLGAYLSLDSVDKLTRMYKTLLWKTVDKLKPFDPETVEEIYSEHSKFWREGREKSTKLWTSKR